MIARRLFIAAAIFCCCITSLKGQEVLINQSVADKLLVVKVDPAYPDSVKSRGTTGQIVISFAIEKDGTVAQVVAVPKDLASNESVNIDDPQLREAAVAAVKQWKYRPYLRNGEPIEVGTSVVLPFDFSKQYGLPHESTEGKASSPASKASLSTESPDNSQYGQFGKLLIDPKLAESQLVHRVPPQYPQMALIAKIQGDVVIHALIDKKGHVSRVKAERGHPMLLQPAMTAVSQWRYDPFLLNGEPAEVETSVLVRFRPEK